MLARDRVERHAKHQGREVLEQVEHVCCLRLAAQSQTGDAGCDVEEEGKTDDSCIDQGEVALA